MKVLQLNLNHCEAAHDLLTQTARELQLDLIIISEPYRRIDKREWVTDTENKVAIWSCKSRPFQEVSKGSGFVRAKLDDTNFYSCYAPPSLSPEAFTEYLERLTDNVKDHSPVAIAGDFNAWATDWGSKYTNNRGLALLEAMASLDVVLLNNGDKPTFARGEGSSIVDLTFVSTQLARRNEWHVSDVYTASDHQAIYWEVSVRPTRAVTNTVIPGGWKTSSFDPNIFQAALDDKPLSDGNANIKAAALTKRMLSACDATMPRRKQPNCFPPVYWWNADIAMLRKECFRARRLAQRARKKLHFGEMWDKYKVLRRNLKHAIKYSKRKCWSKLLEVVERDPWGRPYKTVMSRLKKVASSSPPTVG